LPLSVLLYMHRWRHNVVWTKKCLTSRQTDREWVTDVLTTLWRPLCMYNWTDNRKMLSICLYNKKYRKSTLFSAKIEVKSFCEIPAKFRGIESNKTGHLTWRWSIQITQYDWLCGLSWRIMALDEWNCVKSSCYCIINSCQL
jgi:hypothetical protein